jgi:hypothetical protein
VIVSGCAAKQLHSNHYVGPDGTKQRVELKKALQPAWRTDVTGAIVLTVRYGFKAIEFEKGDEF